jgi:hypothetical protein
MVRLAAADSSRVDGRAWGEKLGAMEELAGWRCDEARLMRDVMREQELLCVPSRPDAWLAMRGLTRDA